ncbi:MAG: hypothetical protein ACI88A_005020 [Paraglaciecola sp.]|jgi:hypothetical protein
MTSDLLFSILPRQGKEPIARAEIKVEKIQKKEALHPIDEDDNPHTAQEQGGKRRNKKNENPYNTGLLTEKDKGLAPEKTNEKPFDDPKFIDIEV